MISERANARLDGPASGYQFGECLTKAVPKLDFLPGYRNGRPTATSYTLTWWFGRTIGW